MFMWNAVQQVRQSGHTDNGINHDLQTTSPVSVYSCNLSGFVRQYIVHTVVQQRFTCKQHQCTINKATTTTSVSYQQTFTSKTTRYMHAHQLIFYYLHLYY